MTERHAIIDENRTPPRVLDVIVVGEDETFHPPEHIPGWRAIEVPDGVAVGEGWIVTAAGGYAPPPSSGD